MSRLRKLVSENASEIRDGICNVIFYKVGRSWECFNVWSDLMGALDSSEWDPDDMAEMARIAEIDPNAVIINGYYCGRLGEEMTIAELEAGIRWHYERGTYLVQGYVDDYRETTQAQTQETQDKPQTSDSGETAEPESNLQAPATNDPKALNQSDGFKESQVVRCHGPPCICPADFEN